MESHGKHSFGSWHAAQSFCDVSTYHWLNMTAYSFLCLSSAPRHRYSHLTLFKDWQPFELLPDVEELLQSLQVSLHGQCFHFSPETGVKWREHRPEMPLTSKTQMSCLHSWLHCLFPAWENDAKGPGVPTVCDRALSLEGRMCPHSSLPWLTSFSCANLTSFLVKCPLKYFAHFKNCFSPLLVLEVFA